MSISDPQTPAAADFHEEGHTLSIVMPAYNEEAVIGNVLSQLLAMQVADEIIVVNDGSTDNTAQVVRDNFPQVILVDQPYNMGNGAAVKAGIRTATSDYILLMDGDGQHPPAVVPELLAYIGRFDMIVGARTSESDAQRHRNLANKIFNSYASYIVGYPVPDLTSGFRLVRSKIARNFLYLLPNGFSYPTTLTISLFRAGFTVKYHPFAAPARIGKSKIRPLKDGLRFLLTITRLAVLFVPLKIFLPISTLFIAFGSIYVVGRLILFTRFSDFAGMVLTVGIFIFLLGLVAEQIALLRYINSDRE